MEKRRSSAALQNVTANYTPHYSLAFWSALAAASALKDRDLKPLN
jgi:hypothetical protein